jgi:hypothetical protein
MYRFQDEFETKIPDTFLRFCYFFAYGIEMQMAFCLSKN